MNIDDFKRLLEKAHAEGWTHARLQLESGLDNVTIREYVQALKSDGWRLTERAKLFKFDLGVPPTYTGDACIVGDPHVPLADYGFAQKVRKVAVKMLPRPRRLIVAGDLFNFDGFSIYAQVIPPPTWRQEREAAHVLLWEWLEEFDEVDIIMGNHDRRLQKATAGAFDEKDLVRLVTSNERVKSSNFGYCTLISGGQTWRVTHGTEYSVNTLVVGNELTNKHGCNVISHHQHHLAVGWNRYRTHMVVDNGMLADQEKMAYVILDDNKKPRMKKGFTVIKNGTPYLFGEAPFTDWSLWE